MDPKNAPPAEVLPAEKKNSRTETARKQRCMVRKRKALALLAHGASVPETMAATGLSRTSVKRYRVELRRAFPELENLKLFREHKLDVVDSVLLGNLKTMSDPSKLAAATLRDGAYAAKVAHEIGRLERGLSTANIQTAFIRVDLPKG